MPITRAERALGRLEALREPVQTLRAEARVEQRGTEGRIRGTVMMMVQRPDRVRFDAMTQFGPAAILTSDGERFALADLREERYLVGPTCPANIARLVGIRMAGHRVARLLIGDVPRIEVTQRTMQCTSGGRYLVTLRAEDGRRQRIELGLPSADRERPPEAQRLRLRRTELEGADGDVVWRVTLSEYARVDVPDTDTQVAMPYEVFFADRRHDVEARVRFESIELNVDLPPGAFDQQPRPGMAPEEVPCEVD